VESLAVGRPGMTSVASIHSASTGLVRYLGHLSYSCKLRLGFGDFFIIENVAPFDVVHGFVYSFWLFYKTCLPKLSRVALPLPQLCCRDRRTKARSFAVN
jgi:hypothetical protein